MRSTEDQAAAAGDVDEVDVASTLDGGQRLSGLLRSPHAARACFVLAHGAGAGMRHAFMTATAAGLAQRGIATFRYQFAFMEKGSRRPDPPALAHAAVRAAVAEAARLFPDRPLVAGGKSFGGRMTSQAEALQPLPGVRGLAFIGFPLHSPGKPSDERAAHLFDVAKPMLFLQGTRDELAEIALIRSVTERLGPLATLVTLHDADHAFHVRARSGRSDAQVHAELLDALVGWIDGLAGTSPAS